eukprot:gene29011-35016_t
MSSDGCSSMNTRIVADVRGVQRDINMASDALGRADAVCEEVIYKGLNA